MNLGLFYYYY